MFLSLPVPTKRDGSQRRTGVEIELGGLTEKAVADIVHARLGGNLDHREGREIVLSDTRLGGFKLYLDTAYRDIAEGPLAEVGLDLARQVVPVEIVTDPLTQDQLPELHKVLEALREQGATGSRDGLLLGYGIHLNPEVSDETLEAILPVLRAYALVEDLLRGEGRVDPSRRLLPFIDAYPRRFVDRLMEEDPADLAALIALYLEETPTRNRGLDMLPLFTHLAPDQVRAVMGEGKATSARPTYHYRLPDCRIDEPGWSLATEWNRWVMVERLAAASEPLEDMRRDWLEHRAAWTTVKPDWAARVAENLDRFGLSEGVT